MWAFSWHNQLTGQVTKADADAAVEEFKAVCTCNHVHSFTDVHCASHVEAKKGIENVKVSKADQWPST